MMAFLQWFDKWFRRYRNWTWPVVGALLLVGIGLLFTISTSGSGSFIFFLFLSLAAIAVYRGLRRTMPPVWVMVVAICIPLFLWGFSVVKPEWYVEWRHSSHFYWMIVTAITLGWLANHGSNSVASTARKGLVFLMIIAVGFGAYGKWQRTREVATKAAAAERQVLINAGEYPCPSNFEYIVTREWGQTVTRPAGCDFAIERKIASVGYEMAATTKQQGDVLVSIVAGKNPEKTMVVDDLISFRLRIMEEETEDEVPVMVSLYRR